MRNVLELEERILNSQYKDSSCPPTKFRILRSRETLQVKAHHHSTSTVCLERPYLLPSLILVLPVQRVYGHKAPPWRRDPLRLKGTFGAGTHTTCSAVNKAHTVSPVKIMHL